LTMINPHSLQDINILIDAAKMDKTELVYQLLKRLFHSIPVKSAIGNHSDREAQRIIKKTTELAS